MTMMDAFKQAQVESGATLAEIEARLKICESIAPMNPEMRNAKIDPKDERMVIEGFKQMAKMWQDAIANDPQGVRKHIAGIVEQRGKAN